MNPNGILENVFYLLTLPGVPIVVGVTTAAIAVGFGTANHLTTRRAFLTSLLVIVLFTGKEIARAYVFRAMGRGPSALTTPFAAMFGASEVRFKPPACGRRPSR